MIKLKDILKEAPSENKTWRDIAKGDYLKDAYKRGRIEVITDYYKWKGQWQVWIKPKSAPKGLVGVSYDPKQFKDSGKEKGGKTIWVVK